MVTKKYRVYGKEGHRQRESFFPSYTNNIPAGEYGRESRTIIEVLNADKTGTNLYTEVIITSGTEEECDDEIEGQISDGIFENSRVGRCEKVEEKS